MNTAQLEPELANEQLKIAGVVTRLRRITTKRKELMAVATLEDLHGSVEVAVFPKTYARTESVWREDAIVVLIGKVDLRDDRVQIICDTAEAFEVPDGPPPEVASQVGPRDAAIGANGHGVGNGAKLEAAEPVANGAAQQQLSNGEGHLPAGPLPSSDDRASEPVVLSLTITRTGSAPQDIQTLERLHALLPQDGPDAYEILLKSGSKALRISHPQARTRYSAELEQELTTLLGHGAVQISAQV